MKNIIIMLVCFNVLQLFSQEVCLSGDKLELDVSTINKCEVVKKNKVENVNNVIISSKRYLRKRVYSKQTARLVNELKPNLVLNIVALNNLNNDLLIVNSKELEAEEITFDLVEEIPLFISCSESSMNKLECFNAEIQKHINAEFQYPDKAVEEEIEGDILVSFVIDEKGQVKNIETSGDRYQEVLNIEARRIVSLLPTFKPGKQKGKALNVSYSFSMSFSLD